MLSELRIPASADFDSASLLTVIICGDGRLLGGARQGDLVPLGTRIRTRLHTEPASRDELLTLLRHALSNAGNASLMTAQLMETLVDHAAGNYRVLMTMGGSAARKGLPGGRTTGREVVPGGVSTEPAVGHVEKESEGVKMVVDHHDPLPVVRAFHQIPREEQGHRGRSSSRCGGIVRRCDRRCPNVRRPGPGSGAERGHGHALSGQVGRAPVRSSVGLSGRGCAADRARAR